MYMYLDICVYSHNCLLLYVQYAQEYINSDQRVAVSVKMSRALPPDVYLMTFLAVKTRVYKTPQVNF